MFRPSPCTLLSLALLATAVPAQVAVKGPAQQPEDIARAARIALTGTLGFSPLPPVLPSSPRNTIYYADRVLITPPPAAASSTPPVMFDGFLPSGASGTGTSFPEVFKYQLGNSYDEFGPAHPLVLAYHGFGSSAGSVANASLIDEECDTRGWVYVSPTGLDDQLFGSPICQQHIEAVIQWMLDNFNVDPDRIYAVGFSMGGGVVTNFAARHRDPAGIMLAAVGTVSATQDWVMEYTQGNAAVKTLLENFYNFGGSPSTKLFAYRQASGLHFDQATYPPLPGTLLESFSMATNLHDLPAYLTYDTGDTITWVPSVNDALASLLSAAGASVTKVVTSGTVDGDGLPAPHSWAVLDEVELFDFFEGNAVDRFPAAFAAQLDLGGPVSWVQASQKLAGAFTYIDGSADAGSASVSVTNVANVAEVVIDAGAAGITSMPVHVIATADPGIRYTLRLTGFSATPCYLLDTATSQLVPLVDSDPATGSLLYEMPPNSTLDVQVVNHPAWTSTLVSSPNPVALGASSSVMLDGPSSATGAWLIIALDEMLLQVKGVKITANPIPPSILEYLPLDPNGDISFPATIPNEPLLDGLRVPLQGLLVNALNQAESVTNLWGFEID